MKIAFYAGTLRYWGKLHPNALFDDVDSPGGTEIAMMSMARALAAIGHQVSVFAECEPGTYDGVDYYRMELALPVLTSIHHDVLVSWQDASVFLYPVRASLRVLMSQSAHLALGQAADNVDRYFGVSRFSAGLLLDNEPYADPAKMWVTRNGVWLQRFECDAPKRNRHRMVWASSPDRGLHHLLPIFRRVRDKVPDAELVVAYSFDKTYESYSKTQPGSTFMRFLEQAKQLQSEPGVIFTEHVSQPRLAHIYRSAGVFVYPCDPVRPTETYCNVITEAMAARTPVVISDADCLPENYGRFATVLPRPIDHDEWASTIVSLMTDDARFAQCQDAGFRLAQEADYLDVAVEWENFFSEYLRGQATTSDRSLAARLERVYAED